MKRFFPLLLLLVIVVAMAMKAPLPAIAQKSKSEVVALGEYLYTVPVKKQMGVSNGLGEWWHEYLEYPVNQALLQPLIDRINRGEITVYRPEYPFTKALTKAEVKKILLPEDSIQVGDYDAWSYHYEILVDPVRADEIISITFHENWFYYPGTHGLTKQVKGIMLHTVPDERDYSVNADTLFYVPFPGNDDLAATTVKGITYDLNLDCAVFDWRIKGAVMGFADSANVNREKAGVKTIVASLAGAAGKKGVTVCDTIYPYNNVLDKNEINARKPQLASANNLRFHEDWLVNVASMTFAKQVRGVVLTQLTLGRYKDEYEDFVTRNIRRCAYFPMSELTSLPSGMMRVDSFYTMQVFGSPLGFVANPPLQSADTAKLIGLSSVIADRVRAGTLTAYPTNSWNVFDNPWSNPRVAPLTQPEIHEVFVRTDSVMYEGEDGEVHARALEEPLDYANFHGFGFYETWEFDPVKKSFTKTVKTMALMQYKFDYGGEVRGTYPIFNVDVTPVTDPAAIMQPQFLVSKGVISSCRIDGCIAGGYEDYSGGEGTSIMDYSGSYSETMYPSTRYLFTQQILSLIDTGQLTAYDPSNPNTAFTPAQLHAKINAMKGTGGKQYDIPMDYAELNLLTFEEDWYYNLKTNQVYKKVTAITFSRRIDTYDENYKQVQHVTQVFTVKL